MRDSIRQLEHELDLMDLRSAQLKQSITFLQLEAVSTKVGGRINAPVQAQLQQVFAASKMLPDRTIR